MPRKKRKVPVSGVGRPRTDPYTSEQRYTDEEREFLAAVDRYKHVAGRPWPSYAEILAIAHSLGYRKVLAAVPLPRFERGAAGPGRKMR